MEVFLIRLLQFMMAISLLVLLHEAGHCLAAKFFGVRVEKFYLFFDPWFHLFEFRPKNSETTYGIGWLPLGGYCKITGMVDESMDTEQLKQPVQPWEFRAKPAWQRFIIVAGGVTVNFLVALVIYGGVLYHWGQDYVATKDMTMGMVFNDEAKKLGFRDHDVLLGTDKGELKDFSADLYRDLSTARRVDILRDGKKMSLDMPGDLNLLTMLRSEPQFVRPFVPNVVDTVLAGPAQKVGIKAGDRIVAFRGKQIASYNDFQNEVGRMSDELTEAATHADSIRILTAPISFVHAGDTAATTAQVTLTSDVLLNVGFENVMASYKNTHISYSLLNCMPEGAKYGWNVLKGYVGDMKYVFSSEGAKSLGGFGAIGSLFPPTWDWHMFWMMTAFLSIILAFMNFLPIPALDGGFALFLIYEMITRRKPSDKFMMYAEYVGIGLLLALLVVANLNDVLRWLGYM